MFSAKKQEKNGQKNWQGRKFLWLVSDPSMINQFYLPHLLAIKEKGGSVMVVSFFSAQQKKIFDDKKIACYHLPIKRGGVNIFYEFFILLQLLQLCQKLNPDIINAVGLKMVLYGGIVARLKRYKIIGHLAGLGAVFIQKKFFWIRGLLKIMLPFGFAKSSARLVVMNHDDAKVVKKFSIPDKNIRIIMGAGLDEKKFTAGKKKNSNGIAVITMGRLLKSKGIVEFCHWAKQWHEKYPKSPVQFLIYGAPDKENPDNISLEELRYLKNFPVHFCGHVKNNRKALMDADVVALLSSYGEGLPQVLLEASALEKPLIAFDNVGSREICIHKKNGLLVKKSNHADDLVAALEKLLVIKNHKVALSPLAKKWGRNGRRLVCQKFSLSIVQKKLIDLWQSLL